MTFQDPQEIVDRTMAELDEYYATNNEDENDEENDEDESLEGGDGPEQQREENSESDSSGEGEGHEDEVTLPDGTVTTLSEVQRVLAFERYLTEHPDVAARVVEAARTSPSSAASPTESAPTTPPPLPDFIDADDPTTKWFVDQLAAVQTDLQRSQAEEAQRRIQASNYAAEQALLSVKDKLSLSTVEIDRLRDYTAGLQIVPGIMSRHPDNMVAGFTEALEIAAYSLPEYRDKIIAQQVEAQNKVVKADRTRRNKLDKLSNKSGGGGLPQTNTKPVKEMTEAERREAMIQDVAHAMDISR